MKNNFKKGFIVPMLLAIIALLVVGGGMYILNNKKAEAPAPVDNTETQQTSQIQQQTSTQTTPVNTQANNSNWKTYTNTQYGFEFKYPADFHINEGIDYKCADQNCLNVVITNGTRSYGILINSPELKRKSSVTEQIFYNGIKIIKSPYDKGTLYEFSNRKNLFIIATVGDSDDFYNQILSTFKFTK